MVLFSYNRIYRDQTLSARIMRGMFVASYNHRRPKNTGRFSVNTSIRHNLVSIACSNGNDLKFRSRDVTVLACRL